MSLVEMVHAVPALRSPAVDRMTEYSSYSPYGLVPSPSDFFNWDAGSPLFHQSDLKSEQSSYQLEVCSPHSLQSPSPLPPLIPPHTPVAEATDLDMLRLTGYAKEEDKDDFSGKFKRSSGRPQPYSPPTGYKAVPQEQSILHGVLTSKVTRPKQEYDQTSTRFESGIRPDLHSGNFSSEEFVEQNTAASKTDVMSDIYLLVLSMAENEIQNVSQRLGILKNPSSWTRIDVIRWVSHVQEELSLDPIIFGSFDITGSELVSMTEENFRTRFPQGGSTLYAKLYIWRVAWEKDPVEHQSHQFPELEIEETLPENSFGIDSADCNLPLSVASPSFSTSSPGCYLSPLSCPEYSSPSPGIGSTATPSPSYYGDLRDDDDDDHEESTRGVSHIHLWQFIKELLLQPELYGSAIRWVNRDEGIFKIEDSVRVARLWGKRKNRPAMNYDKLSRSLRQYYKKGVMKKTERSQRLVYQFCDPYFK